MLKSIDVLIGLSLVMLAASMAVTVMTEAWNYIFNTRGCNLQRGIADLLRLLNPAFTARAVDRISSALLLHPLIRDGEERLGSVIHREELTRLLMSLATGDTAQVIEENVKKELIETLQSHGITDPAGTLRAIRQKALELEIAKPELAAGVRANLAILQAAESQYVAAIHNWFDQTMDRVSYRFTLSTRTVTLCAGLLLACALQLDTVRLINRLWTDDAMRAAAMEEAQAVVARAGSAESVPASAATAAGVTTASVAPLPKAGSEAVSIAPGINLRLEDLASSRGLMPLPEYPGAFKMFLDARRMTGILFTALLLSLGAPFWFSALQNLLQLRSKVAQNDDRQRRDRQKDRSAV